MMLLETVAVNNFPSRAFKSFEYRAQNPVIVDEQSTINGVWKDENNLSLWCVDRNGVVGMTGLVQLE